MFLGDDDIDWQATFQAAPADSVADVVARYRDAVKRANGVLDGAPISPRRSPDRRRTAPLPASTGHSPT